MLLWHGKQADARAVMRPLAELVAGYGLAVVVPDWDARAGDGGRAALLQSARFTRDWSGQPQRLVLAGWSMGGAAAAGLTLLADRFGVEVAHTVCLAGAFTVPDPFGATLFAEVPDATTAPTPFTLLHGLADDVVPVAASREFAAGLMKRGWPVQLVELTADHGTIAGARYDSAADGYLPAGDPDALAVAAGVAARIAAVAAG